MNIHDILYETTRGLYNVEDKLSIATVFIFCYQLNSQTFAELLYCKNHTEVIEKLNSEYQDYEVDFNVRLSDKNILDAFKKTLERVKERHDSNGYYKAVYEKDPFAMAILNIVSALDRVKIKKETKQKLEQLKFDFDLN